MKVLGNLLQKLKSQFRTTTPVQYLTYDEILLRTYVDILKTGNKRLLVIAGNPTETALLEEWEKIVLQNSKANDEFELSNYIDTLLNYKRLRTEYNLINAYLYKLLQVPDDEAFRYLKRKGYKIEVSKGNGPYIESIKAALHRATSYITQIKAHEKEMEQAVSKAADSQSVSVEQVLATISASLGFNVPTDVTLARFNEFKKIVRQKNKPVEKDMEPAWAQYKGKM